MKKFVAMLSGLALAVGVSAAPIDITVDDGLPKGGCGSPSLYNNGEDGCVNFGHWGQIWDLEAFLYDPATTELKVVSGFNVFQRQKENILLGDIFVDLGNDKTWDYAIVFNRDLAGDDAFVFDDSSYSIIQITPTTTFKPLQGNYENGTHVAAKPYAYDAGGIIISSGHTFTYMDTIGNNGDVSYIMGGIMLNNIPGFTGYYFTVHLTMSCGNDAMVGKVSEPNILTLLVLGFSTLGCALLRRKK